MQLSVTGNYLCNYIYAITSIGSIDLGNTTSRGVLGSHTTPVWLLITSPRPSPAIIIACVAHHPAYVSSVSLKMEYCEDRFTFLVLITHLIGAELGLDVNILQE